MAEQYKALGGGAEPKLQLPRRIWVMQFVALDGRRGFEAWASLFGRLQVFRLGWLYAVAFPIPLGRAVSRFWAFLAFRDHNGDAGH